jgi:SAM-dependent methyltransferase
LKRRKIGFACDAAEVIKHDAYLSFVYHDIYQTFFELSGSNRELRVLELGAGGFTPSDKFWNTVTKSDIEAYPDDHDLVLIDADDLGLEAETYDLVIAKDALHHFKRPLSSLASVMNLLAPGGVFIVSEPMWSPLGRLVFRYFHPEDWNPNPNSLDLDSSDPWDGNQALLYILASKSKSILEKKLPGLEVSLATSTYGISYLLSGGVHSRTLIPSKILLRIYQLEKSRPYFMKIVGLNRIAIFRSNQIS